MPMPLSLTDGESFVFHTTSQQTSSPQQLAFWQAGAIRNGWRGFSSVTFASRKCHVPFLYLSCSYAAFIVAPVFQSHDPMGECRLVLVNFAVSIRWGNDVICAQTICNRGRLTSAWSQRLLSFTLSPETRPWTWACRLSVASVGG